MPIKILYIGYEPKTLDYISRGENNKVIAVSRLDILFCTIINPFNFIFFLLYLLREKPKLVKFNSELFLYNICSFFSFATSGVFKRYKDYILFLSRNKIEVWNINDNECIKKIKENIDLIIVNIWELIDKEIFLAPKLGSLNIHPSRLPKNIGAIPTLWSLKNNDSESAVSYSFIKEGAVDQGDMILQKVFAISTEDNIISLENKVLNIIGLTINRVISDVVSNNYKIIEQNSTILSKTEKYEVYKEIIAGKESSKDILNKTIGYPLIIYGEYCYLKFGKNKIYIKKLSKNKSIFPCLTIRGSDNVDLYAKYFFDVSILDSLYLIIFK